MNREEIERELERLHSASFAWALGCARSDPDEAIDVLQTAYVKVLDGTARFDGRSSLKTWMFTVIRKTAAESRRRSLAKAVGLTRLLHLQQRSNGHSPPSPVGDPESFICMTEASGQLRDALGRLSRRQHELMHLVFYEEMTVEEAAAVIGTTVGSARTHYKRGKRNLRRILEGEVT